jgi:hypothetical protein
MYFVNALLLLTQVLNMQVSSVTRENKTRLYFISLSVLHVLA